MIADPYLQFKQSVCNATLPGVIELLAISLLIGILNFANSVFGTCFVIRNKIDVPVYKQLKESTKEKVKEKKPKSKGRKE